MDIRGRNVTRTARTAQKPLRVPFLASQTQAYAAHISSDP